jgi:hypothetical protein
MDIQTFATKLEAAKKEFDARASDFSGYKKPAMPEVLNYLKAYIATGNYPYNSNVVDYIKERETIPDHLSDHLNTEVYLAQQDLTKEKELEYDSKMAAEGFSKLIWNTSYRGLAELRAQQEGVFAARNISLTGKIVSDNRGEPFFIPKGNRTRGYSVFGSKGYYRPLAR